MGLSDQAARSTVQEEEKPEQDELAMDMARDAAAGNVDTSDEDEIGRKLRKRKDGHCGALQR
jgi:hypothetical protein